MREITHHKINGLNEALDVMVLDAPGPCGACCQYLIQVNAPTNVGGPAIDFQQGAMREVGVNGVSNEAVLAILIDRLQGYQSGQFACRENAIALTKLQEAMLWLHHRSRARNALNHETHEGHE
jgi:hypothetical protein